MLENNDNSHQGLSLSLSINVFHYCISFSAKCNAFVEFIGSRQHDSQFSTFTCNVFQVFWLLREDPFSLHQTTEWGASGGSSVLRGKMPSLRLCIKDSLPGRHWGCTTHSTATWRYHWRVITVLPGSNGLGALCYKHRVLFTLSLTLLQIVWFWLQD